MGELNVRRNGVFSIPRFQGTGKTEKQGSTNQTQQTQQAQRPSSQAAATISETLRQLMTRVNQLERHLREGRQTLQKGEAALAEVGDNLGKMESLAREAAGSGTVDRAALQAELNQLRGEIDRIAQEGIKAGFFQAGTGESTDALVDAILDSLNPPQKDNQGLPSWLQTGLEQKPPDRAALLAALGLKSGASSAELLAALGRLPLENSDTAGYLATLYLGAVISGGTPSGAVDPALAAAGLSQFLNAVAQGLTPDQAIELLTNGTFTSMADFQAQFTAGTAPGLDAFLTALLLTEGSSLPSMLPMMAGGGDMAMLLDLLSALGSSGGDGLGALLDSLGTSGTAPAAAAQLSARNLGTLLVSGQDLTGAVFDAEKNELLLNAGKTLVLRSLLQGQPGQQGTALRLAGSGSATLQQLNLPMLSAQGAQFRLVSAGVNHLGLVQLGQGSVLTLDGSGLLQIGALRGEAASVLQLVGGAVTLNTEEAETLAAVRIVVDGPVSLFAAQNLPVVNAQGKALTPFDLLWKAILPQWSAVTALAVDGRQGQLALREDQLSLARLWLLKENSSQGFPAHSIVLRGRDQTGRPRTWSAFVRWDQREGSFQEITMYPNPFTITGGEVDQDWYYEEETQTLYIRSAQVTAISGGAGVDANQQPFSGRIVLEDGLGPVSLTLEGVECKVSVGRAFSLGKGNDVTLLLKRGTENIFESGEGCAGISLGDGTSLRIDQTKGKEPDGTLSASGGSGGAGIGRDSGTGQEPSGSIRIQGGVVTAEGTGGGAGIGGALGGPVGDIRIQGGTVSAQAACCAAAIGAGIQGACGDIVISGAARVRKAQGGGPDGDIGGCLFGNCGKVQVSAGTDLGGAKLWTQRGLSIQMGEATVTLPRFRISAQSLRLDGVDLSTRKAAQAAVAGLSASRRWVARLQSTYGAMYGQLEQSFGGLPARTGGVVRDVREANSLLDDMQDFLSKSSFASLLAPRGAEDVGQLLR
ncbi:MAG: hypothetical protein HFF00_05925 [Ruminiclostridium sp.]|nr:hypothetical protein [Ruminiclostridium sp.]